MLWCGSRQYVKKPQVAESLRGLYRQWRCGGSERLAKYPQAWFAGEDVPSCCFPVEPLVWAQGWLFDERFTGNPARTAVAVLAMAVLAVGVIVLSRTAPKEISARSSRLASPSGRLPASSATAR